MGLFNPEQNQHEQSRYRRRLLLLFLLALCLLGGLFYLVTRPAAPCTAPPGFDCDAVS